MQRGAPEGAAASAGRSESETTQQPLEWIQGEQTSEGVREERPDIGFGVDVFQNQLHSNTHKNDPS